MQTNNNYDRSVFNGDLSFITAIDSFTRASSGMRLVVLIGQKKGGRDGGAPAASPSVVEAGAMRKSW